MKKGQKLSCFFCFFNEHVSFMQPGFKKKTIIDRALESVFAPYKLEMRILCFFMSSVAELEAEIQNGPKK